MLKGIDPRLNPDVLHALASMGHGDDLVLVDKNFPAASVAAATVVGRELRLDGMPFVDAVRLVVELLPLDAYVDDPVRAMGVVDEPHRTPAVQSASLAVIRTAAPELDIDLHHVERHAFYDAARSAFTVVATSDPVAYGCLLLRKGVINDGVV